MNIFDKDGNPLDITKVVYSFIEDLAIKHRIDEEDINISIYNDKYLSVFTLKDNGYDGLYIKEIEDIKISTVL